VYDGHESRGVGTADMERPLGICPVLLEFVGAFAFDTHDLQHAYRKALIRPAIFRAA
jgi:hypothetical protein